MPETAVDIKLLIKDSRRLPRRMQDMDTEGISQILATVMQDKAEQQVAILTLREFDVTLIE